MEHPFEMGGYLPLELREGALPFAELPAAERLEVNTGRTALFCALKSLGAKKLLLPRYYCPDVIQMLRESGIELAFYAIGPDLLPADLPEDPQAPVLLVNYFGLLTGPTEALSRRFCRVILDQCHAFFAPPILREGVMNIYSCRKFIGVSDGAYLIGKGIAAPALKEDVSWPRARHLFKCIETGTNGAYAESKFCEGDLGGFKAMSALTRRVLQGVDFDAIALRRNRNARILEERLCHRQRLALPVGSAAPYVYPLLLDRDIHRQMVQRHVYTPYLWSTLPEHCGALEQEYSRCLLPLPVDQRYDEADMARLAQIVEEALKD